MSYANHSVVMAKIAVLVLQGICLVLLKGLIAYLFTLLLITLLIIILVVEGAVAHNAPAQFEGHNPGYAIAFGW